MNNVLGIETSCDETAVAIYNKENGLLAHKLHSQASLHNTYGGVVPELASRDHIKHIKPLLGLVLEEAGINFKQLSGIAYTAGPGLAGALLVGASVAKSLAFALNIPALAIHHMEGHLLGPFLEENPPHFPFLSLLVSGGHSLLLEANALGRYRLLGESLDDAAGEAFDKTAKLLGLGYPGGAKLSTLAQMGNKERFYLPRPMLKSNNLDFSFSGLKTAVRQLFLTMDKPDGQLLADIAAAFEEAITEVLCVKTERALKQTKLKQLVVSGGVSANTTLRTKLSRMAQNQQAAVYYPRVEFCTDNAAMIALAGYLRLAAGETDDSLVIKIQPRWALEDLSIN